MKTTKFEIAVAGYAYRFKTYARDGVEASVKVKCSSDNPDAECTILTPALNDYLRDTESCRGQVASDEKMDRPVDLRRTAARQYRG